jgi:hypothetical protein
MRDSTEYWFDNIAAAHELYVRGEPVKSNAGPMLAAIVAWLEKSTLQWKKLNLRDANIFRVDLQKGELS